MSRSLGATSLTTFSPILRVPEVISSRPAIIRRLVLLPQPDGPTSTIALVLDDKGGRIDGLEPLDLLTPTLTAMWNFRLSGELPCADRPD